MAIVVIRQSKADTSQGTSSSTLKSGRASLESARLAVMNRVNLDGRACLSPKVDIIQ